MEPPKQSRSLLPQIGIGTYKLLKEEVQISLETAYQTGYRLFDCASYYENEKEVGDILSKYDRGSYKLISKVWPNQMGYNNVLRAFERSQNELQVDAIDLYLIHWPHPHNLIMESLEALRDLKKQERLIDYGVSNFTKHHLKDALDQGFEISANQVEFHPYLNQQELFSFCDDNDILLIAYCPILRGLFNQDPTIKKIASFYDKTPSQVVLRWHLQKNILPIPKSKTPKRIEENFDVFDFNLSDLEMSEINALNRNQRHVDHTFAHFDY